MSDLQWVLKSDLQNAEVEENKTTQKALSSDLLRQDCYKGTDFLATVLLPGLASKALSLSSHSSLMLPYSSFFFFCYVIWYWLEKSKIISLLLLSSVFYLYLK